MLDFTQSLALSASGNGIKGLHRCLVKLGYSIPDHERKEELFGVGTRNALLKFQTKHDLRPTGKLDEITKPGSVHFMYHKG